MGFYTSFALGAAGALAAGPRFDVIFASSPPLPGPLAVGGVARMRRIPFVLDVRDIWPAAAEALGELSSRWAIRGLEHGERWLYRTSRFVTATTLPFCRHIDGLAGSRKSIHLPNGALDELLAIPVKPPPSGGPFVVGYAGNFGIAQGLQIVFDAAERLGDADVRFVLVGDGPLAAELRAERDRRGLRSVELKPSMPVSELADFMQGCHALLVPLAAHPLLAGFVPSKLYDAMAIGRPAIVSATGEAAILISEAAAGVAIPPEDGQALAEATLALAADRARANRLGAAGRRAAQGHARSRQLDRLERILAAAAAGAGELPEVVNEHAGRVPDLASQAADT
jgi:glycosyltransferase involved in cell wall biosynthesis